MHLMDNVAPEPSIAELEDQEQQEQEARRRAEQVQDLGQSLQIKLREAVSQREPIERRMLEDLRQFHGRYDRDVEAKMSDKEYKRSKVFANITRSKTNSAEARIADMLFPADDRNWALQPTPIPELDKAAKNGDAQAQDAQKQAKDCSAAMERQIDDQLTECRYNIEARRMIHQAAVLGTGVLKGPVIVNKHRRQWGPVSDPASGEQVHVLSMVAETKPAAEWVDVWNFFPDLSAKAVDDCDHIFERKFITRRKLRELKRRPGFLTEQIDEILKNGPEEYNVTNDHLEKLREISGITGVLDTHRYELWEYHGPLDADELRCCGCMVEDPELIDAEAVVLFIGDHVIFADINPMDTGDRPYSIWNWEEDETCLFGYGVPYLMRTPQRVLNSAWRMMMDNSGAAVGPQVVLKQSKVIPADGVWQLSPMKLWYCVDAAMPVNDAFATFDINSHQAELANILQLAKSFADEETNLPLIAQGSVDQLPKNSPAATTSMLMNAANTVLRRMVKLFDDNVTKLMITRFYDWNMQFADEPSIKGDFSVDARGSSALMVKEMQTQQLMQFATFYAHPVFGPLLATKAPAILRKIAESMRLSPDEAVPTDEEIEQLKQAQAQQQQPQDPAIQAAMIRAQAEMKKAEFQAQSDMKEMEIRERLAQQDHAAKVAELQLSREIEMLKLAATKELTLEQIKSQLAQTAIRERSKQQLFTAERQLKMAQGSGI